MDAANLSPSGRVLPLAATINGNNPVDEKTGVMQPENGTNRTVRVIGGILLATTALAAVGTGITGIAAACTAPGSQESLGLGIAAGVLGGVTTLGGGLAMKYA
ncbi:type III secretion system protein SepZ [Escherichia albertii]